MPHLPGSAHRPQVAQATVRHHAPAVAPATQPGPQIAPQRPVSSPAPTPQPEPVMPPSAREAQNSGAPDNKGQAAFVLDLAVPIELRGSVYHQLAIHRMLGADYAGFLDAKNHSHRRAEVAIRCCCPAIDNLPIEGFVLTYADVDVLSEPDIVAIDEAVYELVFGEDFDEWTWNGGEYDLAFPLSIDGLLISRMLFRPRTFRDIKQLDGRSQSGRLRAFMKASAILIGAEGMPFTDAMFDVMDAHDLCRIERKIMGNSSAATGRLRRLS